MFVDITLIMQGGEREKARLNVEKVLLLKPFLKDGKTVGTTIMSNAGAVLIVEGSPQEIETLTKGAING